MIPIEEAKRFAREAARKCHPAMRPEAYSEAYSAILRRSARRNWDSDEHRRNWARSTARGAVLDLYRAMHWSPAGLERVDGLEEAEDQPSFDPNPAESAESAESAAEIEALLARAINAVARLPEPARARFRRHFLAGEMQKDIAADQGVSAEAVTHCLRWWMPKLRRRLQAEKNL